MRIQLESPMILNSDVSIDLIRRQVPSRLAALFRVEPRLGYPLRIMYNT